MRSPTGFNTSFILSASISVAFHGAAIGVGFWFQLDPVPATPVLDHGENAITVVWRSPSPKAPTPDLEVPAPEEEEILPPEETEPETVAEVATEAENDTEIAPEVAEPVEETPDNRVPDSAPLPKLMKVLSELARPVNDTMPKPGVAPMKNASLVPVTTVRHEPPEALFEVVKEEPPSQWKPGVREEARLSSRLAPHYPRSCRRRGHQGTVRLECRLSASGGVLSVRVVSSSGCERLDRAALEAVRPARFEPARVDGEPVGGTVVLPIEFRLR